MRRSRHGWLIFEADKGMGTGGDGQNQSAQNPPQEGQGQGYTPAGILPDDVVESLRNLINGKGQGDISKALEMLYNDNKQLRDAIRDLKGRIPKEGEIVLPAEEVEALNAYKGLGAVDTLQAALEELNTLKEQQAQAERKALISKAAELAGFKPSVLARIAGDLEYEIREVEEARGKAERPFVRVDGKAIPLKEYVEKNLSEFLPSLRAETPALIGNGQRPKPAEGRQPPQGSVINLRSVF